MWEIFIRGGPLMYPILFCSIIGWAIFMERLYAFFRVRRHLRPFHARITDLLESHRSEEAVALCADNNGPLASILSVVLKNRGRQRSYLKTRAEEVGERETEFLQRYLGLLGTIANITPLLGLLGTVLGMIEAFQVIAREGMGTPASLGGGISQALITTAAGLTVAVPMLLLHRYLLSRSQRLVLELEEATMQIIDLVEEEN